MIATLDQKPALGGDMAWKKALFLGGAVLLLAACSDAVAPNALSRDGSKAMSAKLSGPVGPGTVTPASFEEELLIDPVECRSGYYVRSGEKDICLDASDLP
jgi:hypothetical protein